MSLMGRYLIVSEIQASLLLSGKETDDGSNYLHVDYCGSHLSRKKIEKRSMQMDPQNHYYFNIG